MSKKSKKIDKNVYIVEKILDKRDSSLGGTEYYVKWKNYSR